MRLSSAPLAQSYVNSPTPVLHPHRRHEYTTDGETPALQTKVLPPPQPGQRIPTGRYPALVLNADYQPLSYLPLSLWSWQDSVRAVFRGAVTVISEYDVTVRSPSFEMQLPSVIVLKRYVGHATRAKPLFTRRNLFLRDKFECQYCRTVLPSDGLTFDHVVPRSKGGETSWDNIVTCCPKCNVRKASRPLSSIPDMKLRRKPWEPSWPELQQKARAFPPRDLHDHWTDYIVDYKPRGDYRPPTDEEYDI